MHYSPLPAPPSCLFSSINSDSPFRFSSISVRFPRRAVEAWWTHTRYVIQRSQDRTLLAIFLATASTAFVLSSAVSGQLLSHFNLASSTSRSYYSHRRVALSAIVYRSNHLAPLSSLKLILFLAAPKECLVKNDDFSLPTAAYICIVSQ